MDIVSMHRVYVLQAFVQTPKEIWRTHSLPHVFQNNKLFIRAVCWTQTDRGLLQRPLPHQIRATTSAATAWMLKAHATARYPASAMRVNYAASLRRFLPRLILPRITNALLLWTIIFVRIK